MNEDRHYLLSSNEANRNHSYSSFDDNEHDAAPGYIGHKLARLAEMIQEAKTTLAIYLDKVVISSIGLVIATAMERVTFKMMIDRMLPYKFVLMEIIFAVACILFAAVTLVIVCTSNKITTQMRQFPQAQIFNMAVLDTLQFLLLVYSGAGVSPTMTVILMHASTFFVVLGSNVVFPNRRYGRLHNYGLALMGVAIALSISKILWYDSTKNSDFFATHYALIYLGAASLQGLSTLYKEKALAAWSRPINLYYLSAYLFFYQFFVTIAFSGVFYTVAEMAGYQQSTIFHGFYYGWMCFMGETPDDRNRDDDMTIYVNCSDSLWLILGYVLATFGVLVCLNTVLEGSSAIVPRLLCGAIACAFVLLWIYDAHYSKYQPSPYIFGGSVGTVDVLALLLLLIGMEVYGRDPEPDVELITNYSPPGSLPSGSSSATAPAPAAKQFIVLTRDSSAAQISMPKH